MRKLIFLFVLFMLSGCHFTLRNINDLPPALRQLTVSENNKSNLTKQRLEVFLRSAGLKLDEVTNIKLNIVNETLQQRQLINAGQFSNLIYTYTFTYSLTNTRLATFYGPKTLSATRTLITSSNQMLGNQQEEMQLKDELMQDVFNQLFNQLLSNEVRLKFQ